MVAELTRALAGFAATAPGAGLPGPVAAREAALVNDALTRTRTVVAARALPPGGTDRPVSDPERMGKAKECIAWGAPGVSAAQVTEAIDAMRYAPSVSTLSKNLRLAGGPPL